MRQAPRSFFLAFLVVASLCPSEGLWGRANELEEFPLVNRVADKNARTFVFKKFPRLAQTAPIFGMAFADFDGDGFDDLALAQNFFPMQPETGRLNGGVGLLMLGDGKGGFAPLMERKSGILLQGDGRALLVDDLNGDHRPDLLASGNLARPKAFVNRSGRGVPLRLQLSGSPGNLRATGSRILLRYRDGRKKACQLSLGSSYLSAPEPQLFFVQIPGNPVEEVIIRSPLGKESNHSLKGASGSVRIPVDTR